MRMLMILRVCGSYTDFSQRSRQSKESDGMAAVAAEKEDVAMQSGSEEGEIEEVEPMGTAVTADAANAS
jgi:hypothetical protein